jgi:hypothetical protein
MKLLTFNKDVHDKLIVDGYTHLEIRDTITDKTIGTVEHKRIQIFKAMGMSDMVLATASIVPIQSKKIDDYLSNEKLNCFVIISSKDTV